MEASDWVLLALALVVCVALWIEAHRPKMGADDDKNEVDRMIDLGQQPGSWEP